MPSPFNINLASINAQRSSIRAQNEVSTAISRLSSGLRINSAKDDAAGLATAARLTAQSRGISQAARNANDAISLAQTAEGALASVSANLQRIRELSVQSANASNSASDRAFLQHEVTQLVGEIDRVANQTSFNGDRVLDRSFGGQKFQVGADPGQSVAISELPDVRASALGTYQGIALKNQSIGVAGSPPQQVIAYAEGVTQWLAPTQFDAKVLAATVNNANARGLTLSANATSVAPGISASNASTAGTAQFTINGVVINLPGVDGAAGLAANRSAAVNAINAKAAATGVRRG